VDNIFKDIQCNPEHREIFGKMFGMTKNKKPVEHYEECLRSLGYVEAYPKNQIRILFSCEQGTINDILVCPFRTPEENHHLYKHYSQDIGNFLSGWEEWTLSDVLFKIFIFYELKNECKLKLMLELSKVKEWREDVAPHIYKWMN